MSVSVGSKFVPDDANDSSLGSFRPSAVSDSVELVCAPPVLWTTPVRGSGVTDESDELLVIDVDESVVDAGEFEPDGEVDTDDVPEDGLDGLLSSVDEEADESDEFDDVEVDVEPASDGSASATLGVFARAAPTPSAMANAPTRPTYLT